MRGRMRSDRRFSFLYALLFTTLLLCRGAFASDMPPDVVGSTPVTPLLAGIRVGQVAGNYVFVHFRGFEIPHPRVVSEPGGAKLTLQWDGIRFPQNKDRRDWWNGYDWDVLRLNLKTGERWWRQYDYPLLNRADAEPVSGDAVRITFTSPRALMLDRVDGIPGADQQTVVLKVYEPVVERDYVKPAPVIYRKGDPMGIKAPVTLQLRDADVKSVFRMLADVQRINLLLDPSVPDVSVTVSFKGVPFNEAFSYLLRMTDLTYSMVGSTLVVGKVESIGKTLGKEVVRAYNISYAIDDKGSLQGDLTAALTGLIPLSKPPVLDQRNRSLYVTATPEQHKDVAALLAKLDQPGRQVMIQAKIIEVNNEAKQDLETLISAVYDQWLFNFSGAGVGAGYNYANTGFKPADLGLPLGGKPYGSNHVWDNITLDKSAKLLSAGINALESNGKGKVLAHPSVITLDGKPAKVELTHNYKYVSGVDSNGNITFGEVRAGPTLTFTPVIGRNGVMTIKVNIQTGNIVSFRSAGGGAQAPETTSRMVETIVRVRNAEPFAVGGLYQETRTKDRRRIPVLGYIPILGDLFTQRVDNHSKSEVAMIVIPYILDIPDGRISTFDLEKRSLGQ